MRLTPQERRVVGFLLIILVLSASIRLANHYLIKGNPEITATETSVSDSLLMAKVSLVDSLVRSGAPGESTEKQAADVQSMVADRESMKISVNFANQETLMELPRIGPAMSKRIIAHREKNGYFKSFKDLREVRGIGPATIEQLRPLITFNTVRP